MQRPSEAPQTPPPTARLLVNVYDKASGNLLITFSQNVSLEGKDKWEELNIGLTAKEAVQVEVICENTDKDNKPVFFDNLSVKVQTVPTVLVVQENHYYPFGMGMKGLDWVLPSGEEDKYQYNDGTEKNTDFDLNLYETDFRTYDAQIGRMTGVDALADLFTGISPYTYSYNNPINFNDPTGLCTDCATDENDFTALAEKYAVRAEPVSVFAPVVEVVTTYTKEVKKEIEPNLRPDNVNKRIDTFTKGIENVVEDNNLDLLPIGYMFIKAWGLYGKQILIYGGTALASGLYGMITNGGWEHILDGLDYTGQTPISGGRSGGNVIPWGTPNSYTITSGGHIWAYGEDGRIMYDISKDRIKSAKWGQAPNGKMHYNGDVYVDETTNGRVPQVLKDLIDSLL